MEHPEGELILSLGQLILSLGQLILSLGQLILSLGQLILSLGQLILSLGQLMLSFSFRGVGGGGGQVESHYSLQVMHRYELWPWDAKLHEFPTLHRFARFTIAYCFTKTTLGHIYGTRFCMQRDNPFFNMLLI